MTPKQKENWRIGLTISATFCALFFLFFCASLIRCCFSGFATPSFECLFMVAVAGIAAMYCWDKMREERPFSFVRKWMEERAARKQEKLQEAKSRENLQEQLEPEPEKISEQAEGDEADHPAPSEKGFFAQFIYESSGVALSLEKYSEQPPIPKEKARKEPPPIFQKEESAQSPMEPETNTQPLISPELSQRIRAVKEKRSRDFKIAFYAGIVDIFLSIIGIFYCLAPLSVLSVSQSGDGKDVSNLFLGILPFQFVALLFLVLGLRHEKTFCAWWLWIGSSGAAVFWFQHGDLFDSIISFIFAWFYIPPTISNRTYKKLLKEGEGFIRTYAVTQDANASKSACKSKPREEVGTIYCGSCARELRVPMGRGRIKVLCPCGSQFEFDSGS